MDYTHLDIEHKRRSCVNFQAAMLAFAALESVSGAPKEEWIEQIVKAANNVIDEMTDAEIERLIQGVRMHT